VKPTISVILPFKNEEAFISECFQSFLSQSSENFEAELIAVDDRSSDAGPSIVSEYSSRHENIRLATNAGKGIVDALKTGLSLSKGDFISRMDGDDIMPDNKLLNLYSILESSADVATGKVEYFATGKELGDGYIRYTRWLNSLNESGLYCNQIYRECPIASPNWMMSRGTLDSIGGFGTRYPEDYDLVFRIKAASLHIRGSQEVTHLWRDHGSRASRNDLNYLDNSFLKLKCDHFLEQDFNSDRPLVLIGAGRKGKEIAKNLGANVSSWITNNANKQGHLISDLILAPFEEHQFSSKNLYISSLASPADREQLASIFSSFKFVEGQDYFLFC